MRVLLTITVSLVLSILSHTALDGQQSRRQGFWIGFGPGGGWNTSEGLDDERRAGGALFVRLGGTVSPNVLLGGEAIGWGRSEDGATVTRGNTTFTALFYPSSTGGFFLKAGVGGSWVSVDTQVLGVNVSATENGFGLTGGLGIDIRLSDNWSFTPGADLLIQAFDAGPNLTSTNSLVLLTLGFVRH
jgi:opacity protein-like surface antigen